MLKGILKKGLLGLLKTAKAENAALMHLMSTGKALERIAGRGAVPATVIDVGASDGRWSKEVARKWPSARYHLVEANSCHERNLRELCASRANFSYTLAAGGPAVGETLFDDSDPFGGLAGAGRKTVPMTTLDAEVERLRLPRPFLVKLDTHGYDKPILDGAVKTLADACVVVIESYVFQLNPTCLRFHEMCRYMEERGFSCVDMSEPLWRPLDGALWQFDLFFIPSSSREFARNSYVAP